MQRHLIFAGIAAAALATTTDGGAKNVKNQPTGSRASSQSGVPASDPVAATDGKVPANAAPGQPMAPAEDVGGDGSQTSAGNALVEEETREELANIPGETKADKFSRLGKARVNRAILAVRSLGKLATPSYESTDEQRAKMFGALRRELDTVEAAFKPKDKAKPDFDFG